MYHFNKWYFWQLDLALHYLTLFYKVFVDQCDFGSCGKSSSTFQAKGKFLDDKVSQVPTASLPRRLGTCREFWVASKHVHTDQTFRKSRRREYMPKCFDFRQNVLSGRKVNLPAYNTALFVIKSTKLQDSRFWWSKCFQTIVLL